MTVYQEDYLNAAEKIAAICAEDISQEELSDTNRKIDDVLPEDLGKIRYVFERPSGGIDIVFIVLAVIFSIPFVCFLLLSIAVALLSSDYLSTGVIGIIASILVLTANVIIVVFRIRQLAYYARYDRFSYILKYCNIILLEDLAFYAGIEPALLVYDLKKAVNQKLIPQGHFGSEYLFFMVSDEENAKYLANKASYDRYYRNLLEERHRMRERTPEMQEIMDSGQEHVRKIREYNDIIKDKGVSDKLDRMERVVGMIFYEVDMNPSQAKSLRLLLNYYLPTAEKFMEAYIDIGDKGHINSVANTKVQIEQAFDTLNTAFERILEKFYLERELDISSDIYAMEFMLKQEGLIKSEEV